MNLIEIKSYVNKAALGKKLPAEVFDFFSGILFQQCYRGSLQDYVQPDPEAFEALVIAELPSFHDRPLTIKRGDTNQFCNVKIGIGTYGWKYNAELIQIALHNRVKLIDTAPTYGFGRVHKALQNSIPDDWDGILATKIAKNRMTTKTTKAALARISLEFPNLPNIHYQIHWPNIKFGMESALDALSGNELFSKRQSIGLCNVSVPILEAAMENHIIKTVQIRFNPIDIQPLNHLIPHCNNVGVKVIAYSPLGQDFSRLSDLEILNDLSQTIGCTVAQLILAWEISHKVIPIPRTNSIKHMEENLEAVRLNRNIDEIYFDEITNHFKKLKS